MTPMPEPSKHEADCPRRRVQMHVPYLCTCGTSATPEPSTELQSGTVWSIQVCSDCNDPMCEAPVDPVAVKVVPLDDVEGEIRRPHLEDRMTMPFVLRRAWFVARLYPKGRKLGYGLREHWSMSYWAKKTD